MEKVEYRLMEKKVDGMKNAASTYTTKRAGEMATALRATRPDLRKDDEGGLIASDTAEEPKAARNDSCAQNRMVTWLRPVPIADRVELEGALQPLSSSSKRSKRLSTRTGTVDNVSS